MKFFARAGEFRELRRRKSRVPRSFFAAAQYFRRDVCRTQSLCRDKLHAPASVRKRCRAEKFPRQFPQILYQNERQSFVRCREIKNSPDADPKFAAAAARFRDAERLGDAGQM